MVSHTVDASKERPHLAVRLVLDPATVSAVLLESGLLASRTGEDIKAADVRRTPMRDVEHLRGTVAIRPELATSAGHP